MSRRLYCLFISGFLALLAFGVGAGVRAQSCGDDLQKLSQRREAALQSINALVAAAQGQAARSRDLLRAIAAAERGRDRDARLHGEEQGLVPDPRRGDRATQGDARQERRLLHQGLQRRRADEEDEGTGRPGRRRRRRPSRCPPARFERPTRPRPPLPDARPASLVLRLAPECALPFVQLARWDRPIGWQLLLAPCWQSAALAGLAVPSRAEPLASAAVSRRRGRDARRRLHLQRHSRPRTRRRRRAHPGAPAALGPRRACAAPRSFSSRNRWSGWRCCSASTAFRSASASPR